ncbi:MAG: enoyl-CoA hydratase/isomerase family protein, partial [Gammaproteobacteria bacterium]|nr:enoyl-CoA hydratase/isomerase family protein [Gammaproteobacteria bacterium]
MSYENLRIHKDGHVAVVHFNRPTKANALNHAHLLDIESAALAFRDDTETRVVIFTGTGKHFSSGADLDGGGPAADSLLERRRLARMGERATLAVYNMDQITIAAWNGAAMGGGAVLATAMDLRIGAEDCFMQYPEIDIGVNLMWK